MPTNAPIEHALTTTVDRSFCYYRQKYKYKYGSKECLQLIRLVDIERVKRFHEIKQRKY